MDLHIHTPASSDYQEENVTYLDILQTAEARGVDVLAFTDHNTVAGYKTMLKEISFGKASCYDHLLLGQPGVVDQAGQ